MSLFLSYLDIFIITNRYLYNYLFIRDILSLYGLNTYFKDAYIKSFIWKYLLTRDFPKISVIPLVTNIDKSYYQCYSLLYHSKYRCCQCYQPFAPIEDRYLLLCNCLNLRQYRYAHRECVSDLTLMKWNYKNNKKNKKYYYQCSYCQKRKITLIVKIYSF